MTDFWRNVRLAGRRSAKDRLFTRVCRVGTGGRHVGDGFQDLAAPSSTSGLL
jgi:hypothetical protein